MLTLSTRHAILHLEHLEMQTRDQMPTKYWNNTVLRSLPAAVLPEYTKTFIYIATKCTLSQMHTFSNTHRYLLRVHSSSSSSWSGHLRFLAVSDGASGQQIFSLHTWHAGTASLRHLHDITRVLPPQTNYLLLGQLLESSWGGWLSQLLDIRLSWTATSHM